MILHRVKINRFGCLREYEASFAPGLNVIKGYNEAGKSTLHQALLTALIERPSRKKANEEYRSWGADRLFGLEIEYEVEGNGRWILAKDFETNSVTLQDPAGQVITQWDAVQEKLAVATGTVSPKLFRSTVCVSQDELSAIADGQKEIAQSLEQMVTGGTEDTYTSSVISKLDSVIQAYRRGCAVPAPKNPGPLAKLLNQEAERRKMVGDFRSQVSDMEEARERLVTIKARLAEIDGLLEPRLAAREEADAIRTLLDNLERWGYRV